VADQLFYLLKEYGPLAGGVLAVIALWFLLRTKPTKLESRADFDAMVRGGKPVVAEFFSNA
jgi:hypothetical protein